MKQRIKKQRTKKQQTKKKQLLLLTAAAVLILAAGIAVYEGAAGGRPPGRGETASEEGEAVEIPVRTEYTEEEKARMEAQTGVTVTEEGVMEIDVGAILSEEAAVKIKREEAENLVLEQLGQGAQIETSGLREYEGVKYWVVRASKGGEVRQVWLDADNGEEFINQRE